MDGSLVFVDGLHPDRLSKKLMRRHVMKGKNLGKKLSRPSRIPPRVHQRERSNSAVGMAVSHHLHRGLLAEEDERQQLDLHETSMCRQPYNQTLVPFSTPFDISPASIRVISLYFTSAAERMFPPQLGISMLDHKKMYTSVLFTDEATFDCNVAMMQVCNEIFANDGYSSSTALFYLSQTFRHVQAILKGEQALADPTLMIVLSLIYQELLRDYRDAALVHFDGVASIVKLRGGLRCIESNKLLLLKIHKTDVILALQSCTQPKYFRDEMPRIRNLLGLPNRHMNDSSTQQQYLDDIFEDAIDLCSIFDENEQNRQVDMYLFQEITLSLFYRLLQLNPWAAAGGRPNTRTVRHIGLLIFTMSTFLRYGPQRLIHFRQVGDRLREVLDGDFTACEIGSVFWLAMVGGIWISGDDDDEWLTSKIRTISEEMALYEWEDARCFLSAVPWIPTLHQKPGRELWDRALKR